MTRTQRTYLDYNATAPLRPEAREAMIAVIDSAAGNASSVHAEGRLARAAIDTAREQVASVVGANATEVVFTSGATEAANWIFNAPWTTVFSAKIEHPAILNPLARSAAKHVVLPVNNKGIIDVAAAQKLLQEHADPKGRALLVVQLANNETGVVQPIATLAGLAREAGVTVATDAVQAIGKQMVDFHGLGADMMLVSAHKLGGPAGVGALVVRDGCNVVPLVIGGGQERSRRGGTENVAGIAGFGAAAVAADRDLATFEKLRELRDRLEGFVLEQTPEAVVIAKDAQRLVNTSCLALPGQRGETIVIKFDLKGVSLSAGSACSSGKTARSETLDAMGLEEDLATSAIRVSLGWATTENDIAAFEKAWRAIVGNPADVRDVA